MTTKQRYVVADTGTKLSINAETAQVFSTPDRLCEAFLYSHGIKHVSSHQDETGWTYWTYERTPELSQALRLYTIGKALRRTVRNNNIGGKKYE